MVFDVGGEEVIYFAHFFRFCIRVEILEVHNMGTGRTLNKKPATRPVKSEGARRRRDAVQCKRLVALGMDEAVVAKLNAVQRRDLLRTPLKTKAACAK